MKIKPHNTSHLLLAIAGALMLPGPLVGAEPTPIRATEHAMTIHGSSTLHDWESDVTALRVEGQLHTESGVLTAAGSFEVKIPVKGIVSPYKRMDKLTYKALESEAHPEIRYVLNELKAGEDGVYLARGDLTIAGVTRPLQMMVTVENPEAGKYKIGGTVPLQMTHYDIKPPSLLLGAITVGDAIEIHFNLTLNQPNPN